MHLLVPATLLPHITTKFTNFGRSRDDALRSAPIEDDPAADVVVLRAPDPIIGPWGA
ncbi:hypothetical protein [Polyangium sp. 6x1]|uniref:hypothetical protein n=1 Tax=Polyangium sp. 6x1 TaxID=3042689 RepID=UPI002483046D|nr:hypothetical protein [Polyangium sp. 6x1]MDI1443042.1 hypothetical protein [Polyangium sp. 6x1]